MYRRDRLRTKLRFALAALSIMGLLGGMTYALLQSQQIKLTGNTIQTATADLQVSQDGQSYAPTQTGFAFNNIVPGGQAVPTIGYPFFLRNAGGTPLLLKVSVSSVPSNPNAVDLNKVNVIVTPSGGGSPQSFTLQALIAANATGGAAINTPALLNVGASYQYALQVSMNADAFVGSTASLGNIDFAFSGIAQ